MADLFVSDLDGTLLDNDHRVNTESVAIINKLVAEGLWFTIATADESYAVANAQPELIAAATGVIGPNTESAVARFLQRRGG